MYVGKRYTATIRKGFELEYRCKHCGFESDTTVIGVGTGQGNSPYFMDGDGARGRAQSGASADAISNAELTLKLCPCPKCNRRDAAGFIASSTFVLIGSTAAMWGLGWFIASLKNGRDDVAFWLFGVLGAVLPFILYYTTVHWKWTTARQRVVFHAISGKPRWEESAGHDDDGETNEGEEEREGADDDGEEARIVRRPRRKPRGRKRDD